MKLTICTPTYNRAYIIEKLYESLQKQQYKNFEWLVVDDGSTDGTERLFETLKKEAKFPINYIEGGKNHSNPRSK